MKHLVKLIPTFLLFFCIVPHAHAALTDNIVSYWKLDESSGNAADSVGSITLTNNNSVSYLAGLINNAADFGSANTSKSLGQTSATPIASYASDQTYSAWVYFSGDPTTGTNLIWETAWSGSTYLALYTSGGNITVRVQGAQVDTAQSITQNTWHHVCFTLTSGGTFNLYFNGTNIKNTTLTPGGGYGGNSGFELGGDGVVNGAGWWLKGRVDEVGVWSRVLSSSECQQLYNSGSGLAYPFATPAAVSSSIIGLVRAFWIW